MVKICFHYVKKVFELLAETTAKNVDLSVMLLSQKDNYERLMKDNQSLKERRAFPEKLEELDRYRNQVLEYSKCITALRQAGLVSVNFCIESSFENS